MAEVLDYSAGFPGAREIKRAGYAGAVRYIGFPDRRKCTTTDELREFSAHGLGMALVYQDGRSDWAGGYPAGVSAARVARAHADAIGFPADRPIYFAVDRDVVTAGDFRAVEDYLHGAGSVLGFGLVGVYGEYDVTRRARAARVASWFWQCRAWSGTPVRLDPERHLYQRVGYVRVGGIDCDENDVLAPDWGQHNASRAGRGTDEVGEETMLEFITLPASPASTRKCLPLPPSRTCEVTVAVNGKASIRAFGWVEPAGGNGWAELDDNVPDKGATVLQPPKGTAKIDLQYTSNAPLELCVLVL